MKTNPRLPNSARRGPGRPRLTPPERLVLHLRPEEKDELRTLANGRQITAYILDCVRVAERQRPASLTQPRSTSYHVQRIATDSPMWMQVAVDRWPDGRVVTRYTGTEYPDDATAREDCARLNATSRGPSRPRIPAPGGATTP